MEILAVEYDGDSSCVVVTFRGTEDNAIQMDHMIGQEVVGFALSERETTPLHVVEAPEDSETVG